jgi:type II secretory ATPase GspE/PulE/Tfp pilus assembly ATPase PilB-like protein
VHGIYFWLEACGMNAQFLYDSSWPVGEFVDRCLEHALALRASDIHCEPHEQSVRIRMRVDGDLHEVARIQPNYYEAVVTRLKILSRLDITQRRLPQDGAYRISVDNDGSTYAVNIRLATVPSLHGEAISMRIHDEIVHTFSLQNLGLQETDRLLIEDILRKHRGFIIVSGATGCGKTSTAYALIEYLRSLSLHILTLEDPVEYALDGVVQTTIQPDIGLNFACGLRSLLRHDPDVVMVGEIRDRETAEIAIQAALTGHLVIASLHTGSACEALVRLMDMGIEPFLIAGSVSCVIAQRLVKRLCDTCKTFGPVPDLYDQCVDVCSYALDDAYTAQGCAACLGSGYKGRIGIFEVMDLSARMKALVLKRASLDAFITCAQKEHRRFLQHDLCDKIKSGIVSVSEIINFI